MNDNLIQKIQQDFDRIALLDREGWHHNNHYHSFLIKQLPSKGKTVLDIACGTGELSRLLARRFDTVMAIDLSPISIEVAKQHSQEYKNIDFQVANILQCQFPVQQFDAIASITTVHHLPLENLLPNLKIALKPGGKLVILDLVKYENLRDAFIDGISIPLNWIFQLLRNKRIRPTQEAIQAWKEHGRTDEYLTLSQVKKINLSFLKGAKIRKHLFWRYSVVWQKPLLP